MKQFHTIVSRSFMEAYITHYRSITQSQAGKEHPTKNITKGS